MWEHQTGVGLKAEDREIKWKSTFLLNSEIWVQKMEVDVNSPRMIDWISEEEAIKKEPCTQQHCLLFFLFQDFI